MGKQKATTRRELGSAIREARRALHLRLREVADYVGVTESLVSKWECGRQLPTVDAVLQLAPLLEVDLNSLLALRRDEMEQRHAARVHREPAAFADLPLETRQQFERVAQEQLQKLPSIERLRRALNQLAPDTQAELVRSFLRQAEVARQEAVRRPGSLKS